MTNVSWKTSLPALSIILAAGGFAACGAGGDSLDLDGQGANGSGANGSGANGSGASGGAFSGQGASINIPVGGGGPITGSGGTIDISTPTTDNNIDECTGTDPATLQALQAGGAAGGMRWLYPYDGTVWPRGLLGPVLQWEGPAGDTIYLRMTSSEFTYQGCFPAPQAPFRFPVPQMPWQGAGEWSNGRGDPLNVELTVMSGGQVVGTIREQWTFALATIKGAIYYNTYNSPLAGNNGAIMKILPGAAAPQAFITEVGAPPIGPCVSCHALSADGSTMAANWHNYVPGLAQYISRAYDVTSQSANLVTDGIPEAGFAGVFPDGSRAMTNGPPFASESPLFPLNSQGNVPALVGPAESHLIDLRSGQRIAAAGWDGQVAHAQMPMFSPDGRMIVYNDFDQGAGHSLWVADFDAATNNFSNRRQLFTDPQLYPGWPFFTPDGRGVVFALGTRKDFVSQLPNPITVFPPDQVGRGHLRYVDIASGQSIAMDQANGYAGGASYLPDGLNDYEFFPTVSPVAAGGYFWAFFTSRRKYGNTWGGDPNLPESKKIWVAAVDIGGNAVGDPSHPAFILPGQEIESGNVRAFAALEPCKEDGSACTSGTECCNGFCVNGVCQPPQQCAQTDDRCETADDCCDSSDQCFGGFCAFILR